MQEMIISGLPDVDIDDLKANTEYGSSYSVSSPQIQWFWRVLRTFDRTQRVKLIQVPPPPHTTHPHTPTHSHTTPFDMQRRAKSLASW